jgi:hypothetical protein
MKRTVYQDYWVDVLKEVVSNPMQRRHCLRKSISDCHMADNSCVDWLKKRWLHRYIDYYDYEFTNVFKSMHRHYYALERGIAVVRMIEANID